MSEYQTVQITKKDFVRLFKRHQNLGYGGNFSQAIRDSRWVAFDNVDYENEFVLVGSLFNTKPGLVYDKEIPVVMSYWISTNGDSYIGEYFLLAEEEMFAIVRDNHMLPENELLYRRLSNDLSLWLFELVI